LSFPKSKIKIGRTYFDEYDGDVEEGKL